MFHTPGFWLRTLRLNPLNWGSLFDSPQFVVAPWAHWGSIHSSLLGPVAAWFKCHYHHYPWEDTG